MRRSGPRSPTSVVLVFALLAAVIFIVWLLWPHLVMRFATASGVGSSDQLGQFGDMFGALSALMASLAFVAATTGVFLQWRAFTEQRDQIARQNFETTFFELLRLHDQTVSGLTLRKRVASQETERTGATWRATIILSAQRQLS